MTAICARVAFRAITNRPTATANCATSNCTLIMRFCRSSSCTSSRFRKDMGLFWTTVNGREVGFADAKTIIIWFGSLTLATPDGVKRPLLTSRSALFKRFCRSSSCTFYQTHTDKGRGRFGNRKRLIIGFSLFGYNDLYLPMPKVIKII